MKICMFYYSIVISKKHILDIYNIGYCKLYNIKMSGPLTLTIYSWLDCQDSDHLWFDTFFHWHVNSWVYLNFAPTMANPKDLSLDSFPNNQTTKPNVKVFFFCKLSKIEASNLYCELRNIKLKINKYVCSRSSSKIPF